ncbi:hypothetical protein HYT51_03080 [Candidatus Woesearchaeota archaeon]|nr:hypothetical protein [Candidatus Woesearchaeota archaeon]
MPKLSTPEYTLVSIVTLGLPQTIRGLCSVVRDTNEVYDSCYLADDDAGMAGVGGAALTILMGGLICVQVGSLGYGLYKGLETLIH